MDFGDRPEVADPATHGVPGGPEYGGGGVVLIPGMRVRCTRNADKDRGFVNGAVAEIEYVIAKDVSAAKTTKDVRLFVHAWSHKRKQGDATLLPMSYGCAMTIRRAQGSTLGAIGLGFDHCCPAERGCGYVGASRVRAAADLYLVGKAKRTDWLPVDGGGEDEQTRRGYDSQTTSSNSEQDSDDLGASSGSSSDGDRGASNASDDESGDGSRNSCEDADEWARGNHSCDIGAEPAAEGVLF